MNIRISVRRDLIGACKTQGMTIWSLRKSLKSAKGEIRVSENRTLGLRWCSFTCFSRTTWIISIPLPNSFIKGRGCVGVGVCVWDVILEYYFQFYKFRGQGGGEWDFSSFTLFTFLFHKFYGEGGGDANPLSLHSRSAVDSDETLNDWLVSIYID